MINKVVLIGRITKDPELRTTQSGVSVTSFTLAVQRSHVKQGEQAVDYIDIVCWRSQAEFASQYFKKGMLVAISGSIQVRTWKDKEDKTRKAVEVVADEVHFAEPKQDKQPEFSEVDDNSDLPF